MLDFMLISKLICSYTSSQGVKRTHATAQGKVENNHAGLMFSSLERNV